MSGRCVAGKAYAAGVCSEWIRPVSSRIHNEISEEDRRYEDGSRAQLLDVIDIPMVQPLPTDYQTENHLIDDQVHWVRTGRVGWNNLADALDRVSNALWINGHGSYNGLNDRVPEDDAKTLSSSLAFIEPEHLKLTVCAEGAAFRNMKRTVRASFSWRNQPYALRVTDPHIEESYLAKPDGEYSIVEAYMCVSLGEPYKGYVYKLIASIITPDKPTGS